MAFLHIGPRLRQLRELKNMSQPELAEACGLHAETIWNLENGKSLPQKGTLAALAYGLGVTVDELKEPRSDKDVQFMVFLARNAIKPAREHPDDLGFTLFSPGMDLIPAYGSAIVDTGVHIVMPEGYAGLIITHDKANFSHDIITADSVVEPGDAGPIRVKLYNVGPQSFILERTDPVAKLIFVPAADPALILCTNTEGALT